MLLAKAICNHAPAHDYGRLYPEDPEDPEDPDDPDMHGSNVTYLKVPKAPLKS